MMRATMKTVGVAAMVAGVLMGTGAAAAQAMLNPFVVGDQAVATVNHTVATAAPSTALSFLHDPQAHEYLAGDPAGRYIVVLGARLNHDGTLPAVLNSRLDRAAAIARAHPGTQIIVSGGATQNLPYTEAQAMLAGLALRGVNPMQIIPEQRSYSTVDNARNTTAILASNRAQGAVLVSSASHIDRAMGNFRAAAPWLHFVPVGAPGF